MASRRNTQVLYVLECGVVNADVLRTLPALSASGDTEVRGLFVEDEDLLGAAKLPGLEEVSLATLNAGAFSTDTLAKDLAAQAKSAQALFESSAKKLKLRYSFRVSRGRTVETLIDEAAQSDYVVVCRPLRGAGLRARSGAYFRQLLEHHRNVLFVNEPWHSGSRILAVCDARSDQCLDAMHRAAAIARSENLEFVMAGAAGNEAVAGAADEVGCDRVVSLDGLDEASLIELCYAQDARLLVMRPIEGLDWQQLLVGLLDKLSCSLLLLGDGQHSDL